MSQTLQCISRSYVAKQPSLLTHFCTIVGKEEFSWGPQTEAGPVGQVSRLRLEPKLVLVKMTKQQCGDANVKANEVVPVCLAVPPIYALITSGLARACCLAPVCEPWLLGKSLPAQQHTLQQAPALVAPKLIS